MEGKEKFCRKCGNKIDINDKNNEMKSSFWTTLAANKILKYFAFSFVIFLIISLAFTSYQYYYFNKEYKTYYEKFNVEQGEKERYIGLFNTEKTSKEAEIALREQKEAELKETQDIVVTKERELSGVRTDLIEEKVEKAEIQTELNTKTQQLAAIRTEVSDIKSEIGKLQWWVSSNAKLDLIRLSDIHNITRSPLSFPTPWKCVINANKIGMDMDKLGFKWVDDSTTSNATSLDKIYDVNTFWETKTGDCEDFSLFMSAWLRAEYERALTNCSEKNITVEVSAIQELNCPCNFHVVCGDVEGIGGHCEVAITNSGDPYSGVAYANNAQIVEPQGGYYSGLGSNEFKNIRYLFTDDDFITYYLDGSIKALKNAKEKVEVFENE
ncbi:MAG: hypothetical protein PHO02_05040 [Candidatus Nanoarchaeia archaeon]|nr:hypothetical protein [Candidatus Nanoarchaeia archaeon]